jgi:two-component system sensor histidine kinase KdpD
MGQTKTHRVLRSAAQALLGSAGMVLLAYVAYRAHLHLLPTVSLCLLLVVLVSLSGHFVPAAVSSVVALLCVKYFFVPPLLTMRMADARDGLAGAAFLATTLIVSGAAVAPRGAGPERT